MPVSDWIIAVGGLAAYGVVVVIAAIRSRRRFKRMNERCAWAAVRRRATR